MMFTQSPQDVLVDLVNKRIEAMEVEKQARIDAAVANYLAMHYAGLKPALRRAHLRLATVDGVEVQ